MQVLGGDGLRLLAHAFDRAQRPADGEPHDDSDQGDPHRDGDREELGSDAHSALLLLLGDTHHDQSVAGAGTRVHRIGVDQGAGGHTLDVTGGGLECGRDLGVVGGHDAAVGGDDLDDQVLLGRHHGIVRCRARAKLRVDGPGLLCPRSDERLLQTLLQPSDEHD